MLSIFFFFNDTATTEIYTLSLHDALPIYPSQQTKGYHNFIKNFVSEFDTEPPLLLFSCAYCHNYTKVDGEGLFNPIYTKIVEEFPLYSKDDIQLIAKRLKDRKSTRLNSSHVVISYAVFCLKKKTMYRIISHD